MVDRAHYTARFTDPDPESFASFLFVGAEILEQDPTPETWMAPFSDLTLLSRSAASWAKRMNPLLELFDQSYRDAVVEQLAADGWTDDESAAPRVQQLVDRLVAGRRAIDCLDASKREGVPSYSSQFTREARLIASVVLEAEGSSLNARYEAAARQLNYGGSRRSGQLFSRDHVRRARDRYLSELALVVNRDIAPASDVALFLQAEVLALRGLAVGLTEVWRSAAQQRVFPWLKGGELARAIHRKHSLPDCLHRALDLVDRRAAKAAA